MTTTRIEVAPVRVAGGTWSDDLRAVRIVWRRELVRFFRSRARAITSLVQPVLFLFVLGTGLSPLIASGGHIDFRTFMFPGVIAMAVLFTSIFSAVSIVWDREFGFLREMLVAPVRRSAVVLGKCLGGATVATVQGAIVLTLAGLVHIPYSIRLLGLVGEMAVAAFALTSLGALIASRMDQVESFQVVMQLLVMPLFFLSGAVFPLRHVPTWLGVLSRIDPLTYAVDAMRRTAFSGLHLPAPLAFLRGGITWGSHVVPLGLEVLLVAALGAVMLAFAVARFARTE